MLDIMLPTMLSVVFVMFVVLPLVPSVISGRRAAVAATHIALTVALMAGVI